MQHDFVNLNGSKNRVNEQETKTSSQIGENTNLQGTHKVFQFIII